MRFVVALSALIVAFAAHAEVKRPGTFVARLCSEEPKKDVISADIVSVDRVCLGNVVEGSKDVLRLYLNDGSVRSYKLSINRKPGRMGPNVESFTGELISKRVTDDIVGELSTVSGITVTYGINLETESNLRFRGPLRPMRTTR